MSVLPRTASAQEAEPLTGDPAIDAWVRTTFGQPVDPETLDDPIRGTRTLLALTPGQREGARLFMQRCNVCHGAAMNSMDAYGPFLTRRNVNGREEAVRRVIAEGTERMPAFRYGLTAKQIDLIVDRGFAGGGGGTIDYVALVRAMKVCRRGGRGVVVLSPAPVGPSSVG